MVQPVVERRGHERGKVAAIAIVWSDEHGPLRYLVEDLSAGGALLRGGPEIAVGRKLGLSLHVAGEHLLDLQGEIIRRVAPRGLAVAFRSVSPSAEDAIQQTVLGALEAHRRGECPSRHVLVVDGSETICKSLQRDLAGLGHRVVCARTPEDAAARIHDPYVRFDIAMIDLSIGSADVPLGGRSVSSPADVPLGGRTSPADGVELLQQIAVQHPGIHRVLMSGNVPQSKLAQLMGKADVILPKPWTRRTLLAAMPI